MSTVWTDTHPLGFVASETSACNELETAAAHCAANGLVLEVNSTKAIAIARELREQHPNLQIRADTGAWRREVATEDDPLSGVDDLLGLEGWCLQVPEKSDIQAFAPARFVPAGDREARRALLAATADLPPNVKTLIPTDASVLGAKLRQSFFDDLNATPARPFTFVFAARRDPLANYQRLFGLRELLGRYPGSSITHVDPLVAADALAHGAQWVGVGASSARRMPTRPGDPGGGPVAAGYLPGLFNEELLEMRSPLIYSYWYANSPSPYCVTCKRALDVFETTPEDKAAIVAHNVHQITDHIAALLSQPRHLRAEWLNDQRLDAHGRHLSLSSILAEMKLNQTLRRLLELDDPALRSLAATGAWR